MKSFRTIVDILPNDLPTPGLISDSRIFSRVAPGLGKPGDHTAPSALPYIRGGWLAERMTISSFSSYSTADSGYSRAVTIGSSAEPADCWRETECQNASVRASMASGAGLFTRFKVEGCTAGLKMERPRGEGMGVNGATPPKRVLRPLNVKPFLFRLRPSMERSRA